MSDWKEFESNELPAPGDFSSESENIRSTAEAKRLVDIAYWRRHEESADSTIKETYFRFRLNVDLLVPEMNDKYIAVICGIILIISVMIIAISNPEPTSFQYFVFRAVLSIAIAGFAYVIPGFLDIKIGKWIKAGGALAVFVLIYLQNPAALVDLVQTSEASTSE